MRIRHDCIGSESLTKPNYARGQRHSQMVEENRRRQPRDY